MDRGHERTEQVISKIEGRLRAEYEQAAKEVEETLKDYMERFALKDKKWQEWVKDGKRTQDQYDAWRKQQLMQGERWKQLKNQLAEDMVNTTSAARDIVQSYMPEVYEINANYALYQVEVGGGYTLPSSLTLYNREAIARLVKDEPDLMPMGKSVLGDIARGKAERWERQKVQSIMMQGILQGKSNVRIAEDIAEKLANGDFKASMRYARTMSTNAQNGGRYGAYRRLEENGVPLTLQWEATLDMRTRHEHRMMHGQRRNVNQPFVVDGVEILYPAWLGMGDYKVPPDLIWNCRCTLLAWVKGFEHDALRQSERMEGLSYEDWLNAKERPDPITKQRDIGEMMRMRYIREYGGDGSGLRKGKPKVEYKQLASGDEANRKPDPFKGPDFTPAKTTEEAEAFAGRFISGGYKSVVNYKGVDLEYANEFNRAFNDVLAHYDPQYKLRSIQPMNMRDKRFKGTTADAAYQWGLNDLFFNKAYFKSKKEFEKHLAQHKNLMDQVLPHVDALIERFKGQTGFAAKKQLEYAEALKASGRSNVSGADPYGTMVHEIGHYLDDMLFRKEMKVRKFDLSASYASYAKNISAYAAETANEYVAESFAAYWKGERDNLDPDLIAIFEGTRK